MTSLPILNEPDRQSIARDLANAVEGEVRFGLHDRMLYATDASLYQVEPLGVVIPASAMDAERAVRFCADRSLPMLPRGGGTSLAGQCVSRAVVLDFSPTCRALRSIDPQAMTCVAEPGMTIEELNGHLASRGTGLFFAPDPATVRQATVGGCIGNNAAGSRSILYGRTSENIESIDALLPTGERLALAKGAAARNPRIREITAQVAAVVDRLEPLIRERFPRTVRRNAGYNLDLVLQMLRGEGAYEGGSGLDNVNLAHLLCGSEGTLALTLGATLRLRPIPRTRGLAVLAFDDLDRAIAAVLPILATRPSAVELLDDLVIALARENNECRRYVELLPMLPGRDSSAVRAVLYVEYTSEQGEQEIAERFIALRDAVPDGAMASYTDPGAMLRAWRLRQAGEPLLHGLPGDRKPITFVEDNAIPVERLGEFVKSLRAIVERHGTRAAFYAHASVGVLHVRPLLSLKDEDDLARLRAIAVETADLARSLGGVMSGEHGDGRVRSPLLERLYGPDLMDGFREIKRIFDPNGLLNPGVIVDAGPIESITESLRVDTGANGAHRKVRVPPVETYYSYDDQHGFDGAVEMCNGAGVCRKRSGGVMCPSYMALQDERHATRGRANALRLAITGQLREPGEGAAAPEWGDEDTLQTLRLCLSCKACKAECPSNVDVARLKAEYTAQGHRAGATRPTLADRMTAEVRTLARLASVTPDLANTVNASGPGRFLINRLMGMHPKRSMQRFDSSLYGWMRRRPRRNVPRRGRVALFGDCFTSYCEPSIGRAAVGMLEAFGYDVVLPRSGCCGRPAISTGLLDRAVEQIDQTARDLAPLVEGPEAVDAILVCEPSCLSAIKDDWLSLRGSTGGLRAHIADRSMMVEQFIDANWDHRPRDPAPGAGRVVLHAHCHQRALWGAESSANALGRAFGRRLEVLDSGCCGMAGSFGFSSDRYDLSMAIGERVLLPAARSLGAGDVLLATGTSCRHQIHDGAGARAMHPVEALARAFGVA